MPEVIIPILAANSKYKRTIEQKKEASRKGKARNRSKTSSDRKAGCPLLSAPGGLLEPGGETCYRLPLLTLQAGHLVGHGAVERRGGGEVRVVLRRGGYMSRSSSSSPTGPTSRSSISSSSSSFSSLSYGCGVNPRPICLNRVTRYGVCIGDIEAGFLVEGRREGDPTTTGYVGLRSWKSGYAKKPTAVALAAAPPLPWPYGPHVPHDPVKSGTGAVTQP